MKSSDVTHVGVYCQICGSPSHYADGCPVIGSDNQGRNQEDANYVGQNNQEIGFGYGSATNRWDNQNKNNPNLSYKPQNQAGTGIPLQAATRQCSLPAKESLQQPDPAAAKSEFWEL
ncbi:unnamed protein product [Rhodiola kirilowii]